MERYGFMPPPLSPALALLACAALLAGFAAAVRGLSRLDHRPRPELLASAALAGVVATLLGLAPVLLGERVVTLDLSALGVLAVAGVVAGADLFELGVGARLVYLARPAAAALVEAQTARKASHAAEAAAAYKRAIAPLQAGSQPGAEIDARLGYADSLVAAGDINE